MNYNTNYTLKINNWDEDLIDELREKFEQIEEGLGDLADGLTVIAVWYENEPDMMDISRQFPEVIFVLEGNGSEYPDMWRKMFVNGDVEEIRPTLVWPEFRLLDNIEGGQL